MTISVWRYSHLALAVSSFLLLTMASVTGILLAFQPLSEKMRPYRAGEFDVLNLAQTLPPLRKIYPGITELSVDANGFVLVKGSDAAGEKLLAYVDPASGRVLGIPEPKSEFFEWVTALHRSLFLHEAGRFFIGLTAFLLLLITISGSMLIIQRQRGIRRFFTRIVRDNFAQYYHVVLGRLSLIPIFIIALTGTYLSLARFGLVGKPLAPAEVDFENIRPEPARSAETFPVFKNIKLSDVQSVEFPFSGDPEDYFTLKLKDRELTVNQITGDILTEARYPATVVITALSLDLHTGRASAIWAVVLAIASGNILFFIYSGFAITFRRIRGRVKNEYTATESEFIILVGSENGSTFGFANTIHRQLVEAGKSAYVTELNNYQVFPNASQIVVMTATYGLGNPPTNAANFEEKLKKHPQSRKVRFSVVGFGSHGYPDFCKFAFEADQSLGRQPWAEPMLEVHTVNDKSPAEFGQWAATWSQHANVSLDVPASLPSARPEPLETLTVSAKPTAARPGEAFLIRLRPGPQARFISGDLLAIYPAGDHRERLYSIGKIGSDIQLSVRQHENGLGSQYLYALAAGSTISARIVGNPHFHAPAGRGPVVMISNGTGIAPYLGMIDEQKGETDFHLYCGFRDQASFGLYREALQTNIQEGKLTRLHIAYSREGERQYVRDLLARDEAFLAEVITKEGIIMLCGSLAMQKNVVELLDRICLEQFGKSVSYYQSHGRVLMDCY